MILHRELYVIGARRKAQGSEVTVQSSEFRVQSEEVDGEEYY